jgi:hypothetical protein
MSLFSIYRFRLFGEEERERIETSDLVPKFFISQYIYVFLLYISLALNNSLFRLPLKMRQQEGKGSPISLGEYVSAGNCFG